MDINIWAVVVAAISSFLLGGLWYSPILFLKPWNQAMNRTVDDNGHPARVFGRSLLFALVAAITRFSLYFTASSWERGTDAGSRH